MSEAIGPETFILVDTNVFVAVGGPDNPKYRELREFARRHDIVLSVPEQVVRELRTMHAADRVERATEEGWAAVIEPPSPTATDAVAAMDAVRREIATRTQKDEREVEKADAVLAGIAIEYLNRRSGTVVILTDDRVAVGAIERAIERREHGSAVRVLGRKDVLDSDDEFHVT
jgi:predicted nucleic acid-binding protein